MGTTENITYPTPQKSHDMIMLDAVQPRTLRALNGIPFLTIRPVARSMTSGWGVSDVSGLFV